MKKAIAEANAAPSIPYSNETGAICFDVETTGLCHNDEVLQISVIDGNGKTLINEYLKPYLMRAWKEAQAVNHITPEMVKHAPYPHENEIIQRIKGIFESADTWIAYNGTFDLGFLSRWGVKPSDSTEIIDVMKDFAPIYGEWSEKYGCYKWQNLKTCASYYGFKHKAHDSLEDVKATLYCYKQMRKASDE